MPNTTHNASLDVHDHASTGSDGYTDTTASNNATYSYRYTGGTDNEGGMTVKTNDGTATLNVSLDGAPRYSIHEVKFDDDGGQLAWRGNAPNRGVITDTNSRDMTAKYCVKVKDKDNGDCTFRCDPPITNKPN